MILAIALGNPLRGDDGVGVAVARLLAAALPGLVVLESMEALPEHADEVARAERVVFLDASVAGAPGEVELREVVARVPRESILHALAPEDVLGLARALHGRVPATALVTVAGRDFVFTEQLSAPVAAAVPAARDRALAFLRGEG